MNYKNLNSEIETRNNRLRHHLPRITMNYKNLNYEIETCSNGKIVVGELVYEL